jgi:hypothetical protein
MSATVKIEANINMSSQGVSYSEEIDTELAPEQWAALTDEQRQAHVEPIVQGWFDNLVQYGWAEVAR